MRITKIHCDGCAREPGFWEWVRGELTSDGYQDWRHPGIIFNQLGCPLTYDNGRRATRVFEALFGRPLPDDLNYLCPQCQEFTERELPAILAADPGDEEPTAGTAQPGSRHFLG